MINLEHLSKSFPDRILFENLHLTLPERGIFLLLGENGCGKSTLLYILAGLDTDYLGTYEFEGRNMKSLSEKQLDCIRRRKIGLLFSHGNLFDILGTEENRLFDLKKNPLQFLSLPKKRTDGQTLRRRRAFARLGKRIGKKEKSLPVR